MATTLDIAPQRGVLRSYPFVELESVASRVADISPFVDRFMQLIKALLHESRYEDGSEVDIEVALREALANAIIHGNEEDPQKRPQSAREVLDALRPMWDRLVIP